MKRIAFIIPSLHGAGFERLFSLIAPYLLTEFKIDLILFENKIDYSIPKEINIIPLNISIEPDISLLHKSIRFLKKISKIANIINKNKYNLIISSLETTNIATFFAYKFFKIRKPLVFMEHTLNYNFFRFNPYAIQTKKILIPLLKIAYNSQLVKCIITPSIDVKQFLINELRIEPQKVISIPNAVDVNKFERNLNKNKMEKIFYDAKFRIINIGRFNNNNKNQELTIKVFKEIKTKFPTAKLFLFGKGKDEKFFKNLVIKHSLNNDVFFMGWKNNIEDYLKMSDVLLHTTNYESFGNVILEALAAGIPVVTSAYGLVLCDIKNYLKNCKFLQTCEIGNKNCFVQKLENILNNPPTYEERLEISNRILREFSKEKIARIYINLFKKCAE